MALTDQQNRFVEAHLVEAPSIRHLVLRRSGRVAPVGQLDEMLPERAGPLRWEIEV